MGRFYHLLLLAILPSFLVGQNLEADESRFVIEAVQSIESFGPRPEGSPGEAQTFDYIAENLQAWGLDFQRQDFFDLSRGHSFSSTIELTIPGSLPDTLVVAVPINSSIGGTEGAINIALTLALARRYQSDAPGLSLTLLFLVQKKGAKITIPWGPDASWLITSRSTLRRPSILT
jgi:hypothetical protein